MGDQADLKLMNGDDLNLMNGDDLKNFAYSEMTTNAEKQRNIVDDVEIIPRVMNFVDAFEGKEFKKTLTLRNIGKKMASVRIGAPSANTFKMEPMKRVYHLPPGLSLSRLIKMKYNRAFAVHDARISIYINNSIVLYPLTIFLNKAIIIVEPTEVNFGKIDGVSSVVTKTVVVKNMGTKSAGFCIDLGRNELELIVEPTKGTIQANEAVTFKLEMMGFHEGPFKKEFWIKTAPPKRVTVTGEFLMPKIVPTYPKAYADFTMIIFPRMYIGQTMSKTLMIKNISSSDAMFCIKGILKKEHMLYDEAKEKNEHLRSFRINPLEGRIGSHQCSVVDIIYEPIATAEHHAVCFIQVVRVDWTDVDESVVIRANGTTEESSDAQDKNRGSLTTVLHTPDESDEDAAGSGVDNLITEEKIIQCESFKVCLYGDKESARVKPEPKTISLNEIRVNDLYYREISLENCSTHLPISVVYKKIAFIDVQPSNLYLKPGERREATLKINAKTAGYYNGSVKFDLVACENYGFMKKERKVVVGSTEIKVSFTGVLRTVIPKPKFVTNITADNLNEVGFMTDGVKFNTKVPMMKSAIIREDDEVFREDDSDLIAFPNDRPQSLRPWRGAKQIKTIFAKIPRNTTTYDEYSYTPSVLVFKKNNADYYAKYLREKQGKAGMKITKNKQDYMKIRKWMLKQYKCETIKEEKIDIPIKGFLLLTPAELHNIRISPLYIRLQRVAPISNAEHKFTIFNDNPFPVFIYVTSVKTGIYFPQGHCKIVNPHEKKIMTLTCFAGLVGRYINLIQVIVNFCQLYTISVMVEVVPKMLNLDENSLNFEPEKNENIKYIQLQNNLNSSISFSTEMTQSRFSIVPPSGTILQKSSLLCAIHYDNLPEVTDYCELVLTSEGGGSQILQISRKKVRPRIEIHPPLLKLLNLPLNMPTTHSVRIVNKMNYDICFIIIDPSPVQGVEIYPCQGVIGPFAELILEVEIIIDYCEDFETNFQFMFEDTFRFSLPVQGHVIIPSIDLKPETIVNRQLIPFAYRRNIFYIKNESTCDCVVRFDLDQYEYFRVTETEKDMDTTIHNTNLKLLPGEVKQLFLHFQPMDALTESFYLPVIVNDIIGPPSMSNLESMHFKLENEESKTVIKLPCLKVTSICSTISLHFSTLKLTFTYSLSEMNTENLTKFFTVKNQGNDQLDFCIRIDNLTPLFFIEYHSGTAVEETNSSLVCKLYPQESTIFVVKFLPVDPGTFVNNLPIYVRGYLDGCIFNYLKLYGVYESPLITTENNTYYLECTAVGFRSAVVLDLFMYHHSSDCLVNFDQPQADLTITPRASSKKNVVRFKIMFVSERPVSLCENVNFHCSCGANCSIKLVCFCDNCYLSHYSFFLRNKDFIKENLILPSKNFAYENSNNSRLEYVPSRDNNLKYSKLIDLMEYPENENTCDFPFIPLESYTKNGVDQSVMRMNLKFVEKWLYSQGFYKTHYYHIPYTIALPPITAKTDTLTEPRILTFLVELAGENVREASIRSKVNVPNDKNLALHFMVTYDNLLKFLKSKGALLPHVFPEFLLTYDFYLIICEYCPNLLSITESFDRQRFLQYSSKCYLDIILQSIKLFILARLKIFDSELKPSTSEEKYSMDRSSEYSATTPISCHLLSSRPRDNVYTSQEHMLLRWLQYHYNEQKNRLWKSLGSDDLNSIPNKEIKVFEEDMNDSLVFACVTNAYCPYLSYALENMYVPPYTFEEHHHNACIIIKAWNLLSLSFVIEPVDIVNPNGINMFLLVLYLYEILPSFSPKETLELKAKLTQESRAKINLTNSSDHPIKYSVSFFSNDSGSFRAENDVFVLPPKKTSSLVIKYHAKKIQSQKAILVLSGELPGQKYGRSRAIHLNGVTDLNYAVKKVEIKCDCYKVEKMKIQLHSPYNLPDTYEMYFAICDEDSPETDDIELHSWKDYVLDGIPERIFSKTYKFTITNPEEGLIFEPIVSCAKISVKTYKMYMVGQHGDWCFEIKCIAKITKQTHLVINVSLPRGYNSQPCTCREKSTDIHLNCPKTIRIIIPAKNILFFKSIREMFIECADERYAAFWRKFLPTRTFLNMMKLIYLSADLCVSSPAELRDFFSKSRKFNIFTEPNSPFTAQKMLLIDDATTDENVEILIHTNPNAFLSSSTSHFLELESFSRRWKRFYKLNFYET